MKRWIKVFLGDILGKKAIGSSVWQEEMKKLGAVTLQNINNKKTFMKLQNINNKKKNIYESLKH